MRATICLVKLHPETSARSGALFEPELKLRTERVVICCSSIKLFHRSQQRSLQAKVKFFANVGKSVFIATRLYTQAFGSKLWSNTEEEEVIYIHNGRYQQYPRSPVFLFTCVSRFPGKSVLVFATLLHAYSKLWLKPQCTHTYTHMHRLHNIPSQH